ncbi:MAG: 16S rRNA (guanine(527)-N(7))-methyltransferase RsmG, partial [Deltaproteobacteria bacterium]
MRLPSGSKERRFKKKATPHLPPGLPSLREWFIRSGLALSEKQIQQIWQYHSLLRKRNAEYDLTRIYQFDNMVQKHYVDCVLVAKLLEWNLPSPLLDIGTGPGLPGILLKIACPETEMILSEGRHKRIAFLHEVVRVLGLKGIGIYEGKIYPSFSRSVKGVITRALESIPKTLDRVMKCLIPGGRAIFMKGPSCNDELEEAAKSFGERYK